MKDYKLHTATGVKDFLPLEQKQKNELSQRINSVLYRYGFEPIQTPTFEYIEVFAKEDGNISRSEMYKFLDRKGNILTLRPDLTPPIARVVAATSQDDSFPLRLCYSGSAYRYAEEYQGKLHEFSQVGVELIGDNSVISDAEVIAAGIKSLLATELEGFVIHLGQVEFFKAIMEELGLEDEITEQIRVFIDNKNLVALEKLIEKHIEDDLTSKLLLKLPSLCGGVEVLDEAKKLTNNVKALKALKRLEETHKVLREYGVGKYITFDLGMVSRLEYYTGIIFKAYTHGSGNEILGGGRYDTLLKKFGKDLEAVGFGISIDDLFLAMDKQNTTLDVWEVDTLVVFTKSGRKTAIKTSEELRRSGLFIENSLFGDNVDRNIKYAKQKGIGGILFFKDKENVELINIETNERFTTTVSNMLNKD